MIMIAVNRHWLSAICFMWLGTILAQSEHLQGLYTSNAYSSKLCRYQRDGLQCTILQSHRGRMSRYHALLSSRIRKGGGPGCNTRNGPKPHSSNRARMGDFSCSLPLAEIFGIIFRTTGPNLPNWYLRPYAGRSLNTNTVSLSAAPLEWPEERARETRYHLDIISWRWGWTGLGCILRQGRWCRGIWTVEIFNCRSLVIVAVRYK